MVMIGNKALEHSRATHSPTKRHAEQGKQGNQVDAEAKTPPTRLNRLIDMPARLDAEIIRMRRNPREFQVLAMVRCRFCPPKSKTAYELSHPLNPKNAGTWCE